jgi:hypothetical protein
VTSQRLSAFIDALAAGGRPKHFRADAEDAAILRTAIALRVAHPGEANPDDRFVSDLYESLAADQARTRVAPGVHQLKRRRVRIALATAAAVVVLVGGTTVVTEGFNHAALTPSASEAPQGKALRTGTFETADSKVLGQIVAYRGHPSWVFMNVDEPNYDGAIICKLQMEDGSTVAVGTFELHSGLGQFSRTVQVDVDRLRGAKLVNSAGSIVAFATFT